MGREKSKSEKIVNKYQIIHNAYSDFPGLLKDIATFFGERQYDFYESGIAEKETPIGGEIKSEWMAEREVTEYLLTQDVSVPNIYWITFGNNRSLFC